MTTAQFIKRTYNTKSNKIRKCSSVFTDTNGVVYSYGYHYPLAFNIAGLDFVNNAGYSSSTGRHIAWARQALQYTNIDVKLSDGAISFLRDNSQQDSNKLLTIVSCLETERDAIELQMAGKSRKNTSVYAWLERQYNELNNSINQVKQVL